MLLFYGATDKVTGLKTVHSFQADPHVSAVRQLSANATWGSSAPRKALCGLAKQMLSFVAVYAVADRYAEEYADEVLTSLSPVKQWYLSGDDIRIWLDLRLMSDSAPQLATASGGLIQ